MPHVQTRYLLGLGFILLGCGLLYSRNITPDIDFRHLVWLRASQAMPLAFLFVPASVLAYQTVPQRLQGDAAALFTMFRNVAGSVGISVSTALVTSRTQIHMAYLSTHLSRSDSIFRSSLAQLTHAIQSLGAATGNAAQTALGRAYQTLIAQAGLLAYMDVFLYCALLAFAFVPFTFLFSPVKKGGWGAGALMRFARSLAVCALAGVLAACKVGPNFTPPHPPVPDHYGGMKSAANVVPAPIPSTDSPASFWWREFRDPALDRLEERAAAGNLDLKAAFLRIVEAREQVQSAKAQGLPSLNASASYSRDQFGLAGIVKSQHINVGAPGSSEAGLVSALESPVNLYQLGFDASWELDLFGKVRRSVEVADARSTGAVESRNDLLVSLEADVAQDYFQLRAGQVLRIIINDQIAAQREIFGLTQSRQQHGLADEADVESARAQLFTLQSELPLYEQSIATSRHALAVLTGQPPEAMDADFGDSGDLPSLPAVVPVGLPSTLARRRPDIRQSGNGRCTPPRRRSACRSPRCFPTSRSPARSDCVI